MKTIREKKNFETRIFFSHELWIIYKFSEK